MANTERGAQPIAEEDRQWLISGIRYLVQVDAKTPAQRTRLRALRRHVARRPIDTNAQRPAKDNA